MPQGIIILNFDQFEGAVISFKHPAEFEIDDKYLQQIHISHNFISSIMVSEYDNNKVNAISHYNEDTLKTVILFLTKYEDGQDFYEVINTANEIISNSSISKDYRDEELKRMFELSLSLVGVRDTVMLKLANEASNAKMIIHDFNKRLERVLGINNNTEVAILLSLCLNDMQKPKELFKQIKGKKKHSTFLNALKNLEKMQLIRKKKGIIQINF
jgi:hypothetical protein